MKRRLKPRFYVFCTIFLLIVLVCGFFAYTSIVNKNSSSSQKLASLDSDNENSSFEDNSANSNSSGTSSNQNSTEESKNSLGTSIKVSVIGDIMCHNSQYMDAYDSSSGEYDFSYVFEDIKQYIKTADLAIGNLETTFAGPERGYTSYPTFNTPEALASNLKDLGIDVVSTANNHSLDKGYSGLSSTIDYLDDVRNFTYWNL